MFFDNFSVLFQIATYKFELWYFGGKWGIKRGSINETDILLLNNT